MKISYNHLLDNIRTKHSIEDISAKLFQLGHEHSKHEKYFDIEFTPNRGDCLSVDGLQRDLSLFYDIDQKRKIYDGSIKDFNFNFINKAQDFCPNISFLKINVDGDIKKYSKYLNDYFSDLSINKNNFFTDVSNFILYETGQPTHCYDAEKLGDSIALEEIEGKYNFETLLNEKLELNNKNLVFKKNNEIVNLAGVIGGSSTSCSKSTNSVIIECAYFDPECIIGKSVKYDINSDAAYKFERGVDPISHERVLRRFIQVVEDHANIKNLEIFCYRNSEFVHKKINSDFNKVNKILGTSISAIDYYNYLNKLGFLFEDNDVIVPSYRNDVKTENDLAEEIARSIGYDNIKPDKFNISHLANNRQESEKYDRNRIEFTIKNYLIKNGFFEIINNPFVKEDSSNAIKVDNPLDSNRQYLRTSLENSLIENLLFNERRQKDLIKLFEISKIYLSKNNIEYKTKLGIICSGRVANNYRDFSKKIDSNFLENLLEPIFNIDDLSFKEISRAKLESKSNNHIQYIEIDLDDISINNSKNITIADKQINELSLDHKYSPISEYPSSFRDLSFSLKTSDSYKKLQELLLNFNHELLKEVFIFDFYFNNKKNEIKIGFRFNFQSKVGTIKDEDVNHVISSIIKVALSLKDVEIPGLNNR